MVDGTDVLDRSRGVVDQLEADEGIVRQLEHGQAAELCLGNTAQRGVTERGVEGERPFQIGDPEPEVQHAHARQTSPTGPCGGRRIPKAGGPASARAESAAEMPVAERDRNPDRTENPLTQTQPTK